MKLCLRIVLVIKLRKSGGGPIERLIFHRCFEKAIIVFVNQAGICIYSC